MLYVRSTPLLAVSGTLLVAGCARFERVAGERNEVSQVVRCIQAMHAGQANFYSQSGRYGSHADIRQRSRRPLDIAACDSTTYSIEIRATQHGYTIVAVPLWPGLPRVDSDESLTIRIGAETVHE